MPARKRWVVDLSVVDPSWADWRSPVELLAGSHRRHHVRNPADALSLLTNRWPCSKGANAESATRMCSAALRRKVSSEAAREAFINAALEANLLA